MAHGAARQRETVGTARRTRLRAPARGYRLLRDRLRSGGDRHDRVCNRGQRPGACGGTARHHEHRQRGRRHRLRQAQLAAAVSAAISAHAGTDGPGRRAARAAVCPVGVRALVPGRGRRDGASADHAVNAGGGKLAARALDRGVHLVDDGTACRRWSGAHGRRRTARIRKIARGLCRRRCAFG